MFLETPRWRFMGESVLRRNSLVQMPRQLWQPLISVFYAAIAYKVDPLSKARIHVVDARCRKEEKGAFKIRFRMLPLGIRERLNQQMSAN